MKKKAERRPSRRLSNAVLLVCLTVLISLLAWTYVPLLTCDMITSVGPLGATRSAEDLWGDPAPEPAFIEYTLSFSINHTNVIVGIDGAEVSEFVAAGCDMALTINNQPVDTFGNVESYLSSSCDFTQAIPCPPSYTMVVTVDYLEPGLHTAAINVAGTGDSETRFHQWAFCVPGGEIDCEA